MALTLFGNINNLRRQVLKSLIKRSAPKSQFLLYGSLMLPVTLSSKPTPFLHLSGSILSCRIFDEVANELVLSSDHFPKYCAYPPYYIHLWMTLYPRLGEIKDEIHVRVGDLPITDTLRDLRQTHLNQ